MPGCGKGYDVALFAACGFDAVGLEVSGHAVGAARKYLGESGRGVEGEYEGKDGGQGKGSAVCVEGDFFDDAWLGEVGVKVEDGFDVIYDNTVSSPQGLRDGKVNANIHCSSSAPFPPPSAPPGPPASPSS